MIIMEPDATSIWMSVETWNTDARIFTNWLQVFTVMSRTIWKKFWNSYSIVVTRTKNEQTHLKGHNCVFLPYGRSCSGHHIQSGRLILFPQNIHDFLSLVYRRFDNFKSTLVYRLSKTSSFIALRLSSLCFCMDRLTVMIIMEPDATSIWMSYVARNTDARVFTNWLQIVAIMAWTIWKKEISWNYFNTNCSTRTRINLSLFTCRSIIVGLLHMNDCVRTVTFEVENRFSWTMVFVPRVFFWQVYRTHNAEFPRWRKMAGKFDSLTTYYLWVKDRVIHYDS